MIFLTGLRHSVGVSFRMKKGIKFHSIYYRYYLFIVVILPLLFLWTITEKSGEKLELFQGMVSIGQEEINYILSGISLFLILLFSFIGWKCSIGEEGIYLCKIDLLVHWTEITAVSHVWINEAHYVRKKFLFYNRKTLVVYRKDYKPICIYNISLLGLYAVKFYHPEIRTNLMTASLATTFNLILNSTLLYGVVTKSYQFENTVIWTILYFIKAFILPVLMLAGQNKKYGNALKHATIYSINASDAIHV